MIPIAILLLIISGVARAVRDTLSFYLDDNNCVLDLENNPFWDPKISWANKYHDLIESTPRFWGSTTFLVWTTDGWHLMQMIDRVFLSAGIALLGYSSADYKLWYLLWMIPIGIALSNWVFEVFFSKFFKVSYWSRVGN